MEILLIGNGFDLEHNLPTSYKDFLDFCQKAERIYTYVPDATLEKYKEENFKDWKINDSIKNVLCDAFKSRKIDEIPILKEDRVIYDVTTDNNALDELYEHIKDNTWLEYFYKCSSNMGDNWIDFESEISTVVKAFDILRKTVKQGLNIYQVEKNKQQIIMKLIKISHPLSKNILTSIAKIDEFAIFLNRELDRLIRALEIYIAKFIHEIVIAKKSKDIQKINPTHVLSFNYSDTYERVYGEWKNIEYDYIHGKADIKKNVQNSDLVLGIDEYLDDNRKDEELEFLAFKKFYQRIYKATGNEYGNKYLDWVDEIKDSYEEYLKKKNDINAQIVDAVQTPVYPLPFLTEKNEIPYPKHTLYIFGHSLDKTDKDILKMFICNDNVQTKIFYYRENEDDKSTLGKLIRNLIKIMGQDELIRRTGGTHKTIEFIPQTISVKQ